MWRLLDPESKLINSCELSNRIVCVKAGSRKSLLNVFHDGLCDPKMALVIDDRLKVWDEKDQPRVHVVPAFAPYHAPQPEEDNVNPVLRVVRNVACEVRGCFFKNFKGRLQQILDVSYDDDMSKLPSPLDVSNFLGDGTVSNKDPLCSIGMADEVERGLKDDDTASNNDPLCSIEMADEVEKGSKDDDTASKEAFLCSIGMVDGVETRLKEHHGDDRVRMDGTHSNNHSYPGGEMPVDQSTFGNSLSPSFDDKDVSLVRSPRTTRIFSLIQKKAPHSIQKLLLGLYKILQSNAVLR